MSRFIDRLKRASRPEQQPMGFRKTSEFEKPRLLLVAEVRDGATAGVVEGADAVLLESTAKKPLPKTDLPVGIRLIGGKAGKAESMDFVVFTPEMPVTVASDEETGKVMAVDASLEIGLLRALEDLPIDALFITGDGTQTLTVTWQYLMLCRRLSAISSKPVLVAISPDVSRDELQMLWNMGVDGVVMTAKTAGCLKELRSLIGGLTPPTKRKQMKPRGIVPSLGKAATPAIEEEEEDDEE